MSTIGSTGLRVVVVDDYLDETDITSRLLRKLGCDIQSCNSAEHCFDVVQRFRPQLILLDVAMPRISGIEACRTLREMNLPPFLLVANTGYGDIGTRERCLIAGFDRVLVKPFEMQQLKQVLDEARRMPSRFADGIGRFRFDDRHENLALTESVYRLD